MRALSLQVKVTLAIVFSLLLIDGVGAGVAEYSFRQSETQHARDEARSRVESLSHVLDVRLHALTQAAADAAGAFDPESPEDVEQDLAKSGFSAAIVTGAGNDVILRVGEARTNEALATTLQSVSPTFPTRLTYLREEHLLITVRSLTHSTSYGVVGAISREALSETILGDALADVEDMNAVVMEDGRVLAASDPSLLEPGVSFAGVISNDSMTLASTSYLVDAEPLTQPLTSFQGYAVHLVPTSQLDARVAELSSRFFWTSSAAVVLGGLATILIVTVALRPMKRITEAARRLGRGEEDLQLHIRSRDEMGLLADVLSNSALAIRDARRRQEAHAEEMRLAAEDFQVAVGALARSVGEADNAPEIARRLTEGASLVVPSRAVAVEQDGETLNVSIAADADLDEMSARALLASDPDAFTWFDMRSHEDHVRVALLPRADRGVTDADGRKVEILLNQASLAFHRVRAMEKLDAALRQKQMFVDILSHDLKNPLAVARGRVEMIGARAPDLLDRLQPVEQSLDRATRIIEEAVLFSKLERGAQLEHAPLDLVALAGDSLTGLHPLATARGIQLVLDAPASAPWRAHALLARALENLVSNAIKWSPEGARVTITVEPCVEACRVRVVDHGPGIPMEDRARLFTRFERADRSGVKGTGLGLAIAKRVVDLHRGRILIEDTPGGGCTFVVELPSLEPAIGQEATP